MCFTGYYIYLEASGLATGANASIQTVELPITTIPRNDCYVTFWVHMNGVDIGVLRVNQVFTDVTRPSITWTNLTGDMGDLWHFQRAGPLDMTSGNYRIVFMATHGSGFNGDISIDTITFTPGCHDSESWYQPKLIWCLTAGLFRWTLHGISVRVRKRSLRLQLVGLRWYRRLWRLLRRGKLR